MYFIFKLEAAPVVMWTKRGKKEATERTGCSTSNRPRIMATSPHRCLKHGVCALKFLLAG